MRSKRFSKENHQRSIEWQFLQKMYKSYAR